jgi:hypothetical protein
MKHFRQNIYDYSGKDLEYRKSWYSPSAAAYNKLRPRYPEVLMHRVVEVTKHFECEVTYSVNDYSPYLKLDKQSRDSVFNGLRGKIEQDLGGRIQLSYLSTFHISRKL